MRLGSFNNQFYGDLLFDTSRRKIFLGNDFRAKLSDGGAFKFQMSHFAYSIYNIFATHGLSQFSNDVEKTKRTIT